MTQIKRLYASSGPEVIIETLQITVGSDIHYLCQGYEDITATTENGDTVTFTACAIDIALPARNADGTQDLKFALCNIDGVVSTAIRNALANRLPASLTYRSYISTDLAVPAAVPYTLKIKSGYWTATEVQITAGYMNILDTARPRYRYTLLSSPDCVISAKESIMFIPDKYRSVTAEGRARISAARLLRHCERDTPRFVHASLA
ncbi:ArsR family transcriptional regulator [Escherichia coli]|nr:ArsR family transcriptional regulator [Escherichia coli]